MTETQRSHWPIIGLAILSGITAAAFIGKVPPVLPVIRDELGLSLLHAGWVVSLFAAMGMMIGMMAGMIADLIGHRRQMMSGLLILIAGSVLGGFSDGPVILLVSRFIEGIGYIAVVVSAPPLIIISSAPQHRNFVMGVWSIFVPAGIAMGLLLSPLLLDQVGWRGLWMVVAALGGVLFLALLMVDPARGQPTAPAPARLPFGDTIRKVFGQPGPILLAGGFFVYALQWTSIVMWMPTFMVEERGVPLAQAAILTALVVATNIPGNLIGGWLTHRGIRGWILIAVGHTITAATAVAIFSDVLPDAYRLAACFLFSGLTGILPAATFAILPDHAPTPRHLGVTSGLLLQGSNSGNFVGPLVFAAVVSATGSWAGNVWIVVGLSAFGFALAMGLARIQRRGASA